MSIGTRPVALIVDDEPPVRSVVRQILENGGWCAVEARDGGEALRLLATLPRIDLLVTDLQMPVLNGKELAAAVRRLRPRLRVLYLTGFSEMLFTSTPVLADGEAFLDKPFTPQALLEAVSLLFFGTRQPAGHAHDVSWTSRLLARIDAQQVEARR
jgi:CheY-like chemotaxis protein